MPDLMSERFREAEARCEAATKGPWVSGLPQDYDPRPADADFDDIWGRTKEPWPKWEPVFVSRAEEAGNRDHIAHARTDLPEALVALEVMANALEELERRLGGSEEIAAWSLAREALSDPRVKPWLAEGGE